MEFSYICQVFEELEKKSKRLEKILLLRDFLENDKKEGKIVFDIIAGNYQREINKKSIGISLKTIFSVISFISKTSESEVEKLFNKVGDLGGVCMQVLKSKKQTGLFNRRLTLKDILSAFETISKTSGTNSNKIKKEILSNLFLLAQTDLEHKFLARLLIDDLRIGVSEGVLKEAAVNMYFPKIIGINLMCFKCSYLNLNLKECMKCKTKLELPEQSELFARKYSVVELETPKKETSLKDYNIEYEINPVEFALRRDREKYVLKTSNPREIYNIFLNSFEMKYNLINSFSKVLKELDENLSNILNLKIIVGNPIRSMLGTRSNSVKQSFEMTSRPALLDYKYDGLRVQIHNNYGEVRLFSRNLDEITKQFPEVVEFIKNNFSDLSFVVDSECVGYDFDKQEFLPFQVLSRRILTKNVSEVSHINVVVKAFDLLYLNEETLINDKYSKRRELLETIFLNRKLKQKLYFDVEMLK